jgi:hypothetical protein
MDKYNEFVEELSAYNSSSKARVKLAIFIHKFFRFFTTKSFDFIISLLLINGVVMLFTFSVTLNLIISATFGHILYWFLIYKPLSKRFENTMYQDFTLRIEILQDIISRK